MRPGVIGAYFAPVVVSRERERAQGLNHQPRHDVLALVLVLDVDPFAVEYADVVVEDAVSVAVDQSAVELCAQVASRGVDTADVGEPHQAADRHRIFDEFVFERHVVRVLDRERNLELSDLHVEGFQRFVAQVDVDDLGRCEFELQPVVDLGRNVALEVHAGAFDEEGRCVVAPFVTQLQIAGDAREARQDPVGGRRPAFERFDLRERRSTVAASESRCCAAPRVAGKRPAATASARRSLFMDRKDCFAAAKFERYSRISLRENT